MKVRINITLSEKAVIRLKDVDNVSQYIEDLILGNPTAKVLEVTSMQALENMLDAKLEQIKKMSFASQNNQVNERYARQGDPRAGEDPVVELGYACCKEDKPCKHWVWDSATGDGYINSITGELREV